MKAVVVERIEDKVILLKEDGSFEERSARLSGRTLEVGEEIRLKEQKKLTRFASMVTAAAAALVMLVMGGTWFLRPTGYVDVRINPGVRIAVDRFGNAKGVEAINEDGVQFLARHPLEKGSAEETFQNVLLAAVEDGYLTDGLNSVKVIVTDEDNGRKNTLQNALMTAAEATLGESTAPVTVMTLDAKDYDRLKEEAETAQTAEADPYETYRSGQWRENAREVSLCDVEWDDGGLEIEFSRDVNAQNAAVKVVDQSGAAFSADILEREEDELLLDLSDVEAQGVVTLSVSGLTLPDGTEVPEVSALLRLPAKRGAQEELPVQSEERTEELPAETLPQDAPVFDPAADDDHDGDDDRDDDDDDCDDDDGDDDDDDRDDDDGDDDDNDRDDDDDDDDDRGDRMKKKN